MRAAFGLFDRDGDGTISVKVNLPSFFTFLQVFVKTISVEETISILFDYSSKELGSVLKTMGHQATEEMLHKMIKVGMIFGQEGLFWRYCNFSTSA